MTDRNRNPNLARILAESPILSVILGEWAKVGLPDGWLVAGAVAQTVWNHCLGLAPDYGLKDIDLVYFDHTDLSEESERCHEERIRRHFGHLSVKIDVKNEARVHLWYAAKFGEAIAPYASSADAIRTFPTTATAIGVQPGPHGLSVIAPYGLSDLLDLIVRPNKIQITRAVYEVKIARWRALWPRLQIVAWEAC